MHWLSLVQHLIEMRLRNYLKTALVYFVLFEQLRLKVLELHSCLTFLLTCCEDIFTALDFCQFLAQPDTSYFLSLPLLHTIFHSVLR